MAFQAPHTATEVLRQTTAKTPPFFLVGEEGKITVAAGNIVPRPLIVTKGRNVVKARYRLPKSILAA